MSLARTTGRLPKSAGFRRSVESSSEINRAADVWARNLTARFGPATAASGHVLYHLEMMDVLSPEQVERYNTLRSYR